MRWRAHSPCSAGRRHCGSLCQSHSEAPAYPRSTDRSRLSQWLSMRSGDVGISTTSRLSIACPVCIRRRNAKTPYKTPTSRYAAIAVNLLPPNDALRIMNPSGPSFLSGNRKPAMIGDEAGVPMTTAPSNTCPAVPTGLSRSPPSPRCNSPRAAARVGVSAPETIASAFPRYLVWSRRTQGRIPEPEIIAVLRVSGARSHARGKRGKDRNGSKQQGFQNGFHIRVEWSTPDC